MKTLIAVSIVYTLAVWITTACMVVSTHNPLWLLLLLAL